MVEKMKENVENYEEIEWYNDCFLNYYEAIVKADARASEKNIQAIYDEWGKNNIHKLVSEEFKNELIEMQKKLDERRRQENGNVKVWITSLKTKVREFMENKR